jgi:hypothetical protein
LQIIVFKVVVPLQSERRNMPTFESVGVHPELRKRLVTESAPGEYQLVLTPQALLSRNPATLKLLDIHHGSGPHPDARTVPLAKAERLRHDVALALIKNKTTKTTTTTSSQEHSKIFPGTISAWHLWKHERDILTQSPPPPLLLTRCKKLDEMISLPIEYSTGVMNKALSLDMSSQVRSGISFGQIIQFSGPPGTAKTQLALQIASSPGLQETFYICSSGGNLNPTRLWEISNHNRNVMQRTKFTMATDEFQLFSRLGEFEASSLLYNRTTTTTTTTPSRWKPILLVIDSCSECLSSENSSEVLVTIGQTIRRLTRQYMIATILINGTVSNHRRGGGSGAGATTMMTTTTSDEPPPPPLFRSHKPALGRSWRTVADVHVWLEEDTTATATKSSQNSGTTTLQAIHRQEEVRRIRCHLDSHASKRTDHHGSVKGVFTVTAEGIQDVNL